MQKPKLVHVDEAKYFQNTAPLRFDEQATVPRWIVGAVALLFAVAVILWAAVSFGAELPASLPVVVAPSDLTKQLLELAGAALLAGLTWASAAIKAYFSAHAKGAVGNYALGVYQRLDDAVMTAVTMVEQQTLRDFATGMTSKNAAQAKSDAVVYVKSYLGQKGLAELATIVGFDNVAAVISGKIESAVLANKAPAALQTQNVTVQAPAA